jgi:hypothetical protein
LTSLARVETRLAKKPFELVVVCAMVFIEMNWKQTTKGNTLAMSFITLQGGFGFLFMISFFFSFPWLYIRVHYDSRRIGGKSP